jgi:hypothetical protein
MTDQPPQDPYQARPGWYADPGGQQLLRWWDGRAWTPHIQPGPDMQPGAAPYGTGPTSYGAGLGMAGQQQPAGHRSPKAGRNSHWVRNILTGMGAIVAAGIIINALADHGSTSSISASSTAAAASAPAAASPDSHTSPAGGTVGHVGDTATFTDSADGWSYSATLVKVLDPAEPDNSFDAADSGKRLVGAEFKLTGITGKAQDDANIDAAIQGSNSQLYSPTFSGLAAGTNFNNGDFSLTPGSTEVGWVTFELPHGVKVAQVQWDPSFSGSPVTWVITGS